MRRLWNGLGIVAYWLTWPALWLYLRPSTRTRVMMITPDRKVLLMKGWLGSGKWILPGGGLHGKEDPEQGALREVFEETGIQLTTSDLKLLDRGLMTDAGLKFKTIAYRVQLPEKPKTTPQKLEVTHMTWMPLDDLHDLSPLTRELIEQWSD